MKLDHLLGITYKVKEQNIWKGHNKPVTAIFLTEKDAKRNLEKRRAK